MKFLVIGLGSMGKRRVRNLLALGHSVVCSFDPRSDRCDEARRLYGVRATQSLQEALSENADAWVISTPPDTHMQYAEMAVSARAHFFVEAGLPDRRTRKVAAAAQEAGLVGVPSCTMRYYAGPQKIQELVRDGVIGNPIVFSYQSGQHLADWHPWEDIQDYYVSKRETGGCREIVPFELAWLTELFGNVRDVRCVVARSNLIDAPIEDSYQLLLTFESSVSGHLLVDVLARPAVRFMRIIGSSGTLEWSNAEHRIRVCRGTSESWEEFSLEAGNCENGYINPEEPYIAEVRDFVSAIRRDSAYPYEFSQDEHVLDILLRAEANAGLVI